MEQRDYWDSVSEKKEFTTPFQGEAFARYVGKEAFIVDIGCGCSFAKDKFRKELVFFVFLHWLAADNAGRIGRTACSLLVVVL